MVRTTAKRGPREGRPLWRCTDFSCPTVINIDETDATPIAPVAGESAQARYELEQAAYFDRVKRGAVLLASVAVLVALGAFFAASMIIAIPLAAGAGLIVILLFTLALFRYIPNEINYWRQGAESERRVGAKLASLEALGFVTLYDRRMRGRGGNIDAVTVGPAGVFIIESKYRGRGVEVIQGRLEVGGREQADPVRQVTDQAMFIQFSIAQAMNRHRLTVVPIICIGNRTVGGGERSGGVLVLDVNSIAKRLASEPAVLSVADVQELAMLLDRALPPYERRHV